MERLRTSKASLLSPDKEETPAAVPWQSEKEGSAGAKGVRRTADDSPLLHVHH